MNWKNFCHYYRRYFGYLIFFSIFSYSLYFLVSLFSSEWAPLITLEVLIVLLVEACFHFEKKLAMQSRLKAKKEELLNALILWWILKDKK